MDKDNPSSKYTNYLKYEIVSNIYQCFSVDNDITIGRAKDNDIVLANFSISGHHAVIFSKGDDVWVEDLGSTNGTLVNDIIIQKKSLHNDDVVSIGYANIVFKRDLQCDKIVDLRNNRLAECLPTLLQQKDFTLIFGSSLQKLDELLLFLREKINQVPCNDSPQEIVEALKAAIDNAAKHGNHNDNEKNIELRYQQQDSCVIITLVDQGEGFDYCDYFKNRGKNKSGKGLELLTKLFDSIEYNHKGNQIRLVKNLFCLQTSATKTSRTSKSLKRYLSVRYFKQMINNKCFSFDLVASQKVLKIFPENMKLTAHNFEDREAVPLQIVPVFPGCLCAPYCCEMDVSQTLVKNRFWITPLINGKVENASLRVMEAGKIIHVIEMPFRVANKSLCRFFMILSLLLPTFFILLDIPYFPIKDKLPTIILQFIQIIRNLGGLSMFGIMLGACSLFIAMFLHLRMGPSIADIIYDTLQIELRKE